jgi:hypothetical protein
VFVVVLDTRIGTARAKDIQRTICTQHSSMPIATRNAGYIWIFVSKLYPLRDPAEKKSKLHKEHFKNT